MAEILPDSRAKDRRTFISLGQAGTWVPIFCANCSHPGGAVPEENTTFAFYLCNKCVEGYGPIAATMMVPDEIFWDEVAAEQGAKRQKEEDIQCPLFTA